jgi:hypothetical protein
MNTKELKTVDTNFDKAEQGLRIYCSRHLGKIFNPFNKDIYRDFSREEIDLSLDFLTHVLRKEIDEPRLQELDEKFYSAFEQYLTTSRLYFGSVLNGIERLSSLFEPFLKKVVYIYFKAKRLPGTKTPLWHAGIDQILNTFGFIKAEIKNDKDEYWIKQPFEQAIFRLEYVTRHKGVHESHFYTLEQVENIANSIIASYFLVSFFLVSKRDIKQNFLDKLEVRNLSYLLKSKTVSYPSTGSLLTQKEHIKLYKYRTEIEIDDDLLKFLFINYLAGNGPIFFWIKDTEKKKLISWAKEFLKSPNEDIQRNAIRFLILLGKQFPLSYLAKLFLEYELKEECVTYIEKFGTRKDIDLFITLGRKKKLEEVRYAAKEVCVKFLTMRYIKKLEKMAYSTNLDNRLLFEKVVLKNAVKESFKKYRADIINKDIYKRLVAIYSLGIVGDSNDLKNFKSEFKKKRLNHYLKEAYLKSIIRLLVKFEEMDSVTKFINRRNHFISETAILVLPEDFINSHLTDLLKIYNKHPYEISNRVYEFTKKEFIKPIEEILAQAVLDNRVRYLVLSLCKVGDYNVFEFLIKLFIDYMDEIDFWNHVYIARSMSRIVSDKNKKILRKIISSDEFWKYYGEKRPKNKRMPVKDYRNVYFIKRLVGIIYPIVADYIDLSLLKKMLLHEYKMTAISAAKRIGVLAKEKDLNSIIDTTLKQDNDYILSNFVICLREIDKNIYKLKEK